MLNHFILLLWCAVGDEVLLAMQVAEIRKRTAHLPDDYLVVLAGTGLPLR